MEREQFRRHQIEQITGRHEITWSRVHRYAANEEWRYLRKAIKQRRPELDDWLSDWIANDIGDGYTRVQADEIYSYVSFLFRVAGFIDVDGDMGWVEGVADMLEKIEEGHLHEHLFLHRRFPRTFAQRELFGIPETDN